MQELFRIISEYPWAAMAAAFAALLIVVFLFRKLVRLALILLVIAVAIGGFLYFQYPKERPANFREAVEKARSGTGLAVEKGKEAVEKGRKMVGKGKEALGKGKQMVEKGQQLVDKGIDKGKEIVDKGKDKVDEFGKRIVGEKAPSD
jgi:hypothetical protein